VSSLVLQQTVDGRAFLTADMSNFSRKYKKESCRTLVGFIRCLTGEIVQVDLYGGVMLVGNLIDLDAQDNLHLSSVTIARPLAELLSVDRLCLRFGNVRCIRIPDQIDVMATIRGDLRRLNPKASDIVGGGQKKRTTFVFHREK
jgi:small nuclear ribonucleoprotein (snRNP)-like protein